ncbi:M16 family metallopeptidase [Autumnicola musiva]|uniref:Insulinase family protein n=1 Tax=Autumnicola musiva TaxID=3075589 RepID=A0ABU3D673_9FLAO|nr:insulinase family protein [Zunongwangia sp. F117]MDT0677027.1 insulinase family protein [Zunongwangia sp. F117]
MIYNKMQNMVSIPLVVLCSINLLLGQNNKMENRNLNTLENHLQYGKFANGFSYYIKQSGDNSGKIHLNLLVKVGSLQEDENQMDIAHAVEHLVSEGSTNFPRGIKQDYEKFAGKGVAYKIFNIGLDKTEYQLIVPTGNGEAFNAAMLFYKDILSGITLSETDINSERGVLRQEFISQTDQNLETIMLQSSLRSQLFPCRNDFSTFFRHNKDFPIEEVRKFYRDWYRPDLMTLIVTGDIVDPLKLQNTITKTFSNVPNKPNPRPIKNCDSLYFTQPDQYVVIERNSDSIKQQKPIRTEIQLFFRDPKMAKMPSPFGRAKRKLIWEAMTRTLNDRFKEQSNEYLNTFDILSRYSYKSHPPALKLELNSDPGEETLGLKRMMYILNQMKEFGLKPEEWALVKNELLSGLQGLNFKDSSFLLNQIRDFEIYSEGMGEEEIEKQIYWLSHLSLPELNRSIKNMIHLSPNDIGIITSQNSGISKFSEQQFRNEIQKVHKRPLQEYTPLETPNVLMNENTKKALEPANYKTIGVGAYGEKILELQNGVRIILMNYTPTSGFNQEKIVLHGFRNQGASSFPEEDYFSSINAPKIVKNSGVGKFDKFQLNRFLKNNSFWQGVQPYIEYEETGIKGSADPQDFEGLLQLIYLFITQPRQDPLAFKDWKKNEEAFIENPPSDKVYAYLTDAIAELLDDKATTLNGARALKGIDNTRMDTAYRIFDSLYGNADRFSFIITGAFQEEKIISLVSKYLGNLPSNRRSLPKPTSTDYSKIPKGPIFKEFHSPFPQTSDRYTTKFIIKEKGVYDWQEEIKVQLLGMITNHKIQFLRYENKLSVYQKGAMGIFEDKLDRMEVGVTIACQQSDFKAIREACNQIYVEIKRGDFEKAIFEDSKSNLANYYREAYMERNDQMNNKLYEVYRYNRILPDSNQALDYIATLSKEDITDLAKIYFQENNRYEFVWRANNQ